MEWKQTDGQTDGLTLPIALPSWLTRSLVIVGWNDPTTDVLQQKPDTPLSSLIDNYIILSLRRTMRVILRWRPVTSYVHTLICCAHGVNLPIKVGGLIWRPWSAIPKMGSGGPEAEPLIS